MPENSAKKPPKRYEVRTLEKVVRRTDDLAAAEAKLQELRKENASYFRLTDRGTGDVTTWKKETYQQNYLKTVVPAVKKDTP